MVAWLNRTVVQAPRNGTTSHTVNFGWTATAGRFILIVANGSVTSTTPSGYTLPSNGSAVNNTGLYVWYKASAAGTETSFSTTHNASDYPAGFAIYEFPSGTTWKSAIAATGVPRLDAGPNLTGLTGTNWLAGLVGQANATAVSEAVTWTGTPTPTENVDITEVKTTTDGYNMSLCYVEASTATSFQPTGSSSGAPNKEAITFALSVPTGGSSFSASPNVSGSGTLSVVTRLAVQGSSTLSGAGTLSASGQAAVATLSDLAGSGSLSVLTGVNFTRMVGLSGSGTLSGSPTSNYSANVTLSGAGALTAFTFADTGEGEITAYLGATPVAKLYLGVVEVSKLI